MGPFQAIARHMLNLLMGGLLIAIDVPVRQVVGAQRLGSTGASEGPVTGWQWDLLPDELGHLLEAIAFLSLARTVAGPLRSALTVLGLWQGAMILMALLSHKVHDVAMTATTEVVIVRDSAPTSVWLTFGLVTVLTVATGWCLAWLCRSHDLREGARAWRRNARWVSIAAVGTFAFAVWVESSLTDPSQSPFDWPVNGLSKYWFFLAGLGLAIAITVGITWIHSCLVTRAEAHAKAFD